MAVEQDAGSCWFVLVLDRRTTEQVPTGIEDEVVFRFSRSSSGRRNGTR